MRLEEIPSAKSKRYVKIYLSQGSEVRQCEMNVKNMSLILKPTLAMFQEVDLPCKDSKVPKKFGQNRNQNFSRSQP